MLLGTTHGLSQACRLKPPQAGASPLLGPDMGSNTESHVSAKHTKNNDTSGHNYCCGRQCPGRAGPAGHAAHRATLVGQGGLQRAGGRGAARHVTARRGQHHNSSPRRAASRPSRCVLVQHITRVWTHSWIRSIPGNCIHEWTRSNPRVDHVMGAVPLGNRDRLEIDSTSRV